MSNSNQKKLRNKPRIVVQVRQHLRKLSNHAELLSPLRQRLGHQSTFVEFLGNETARETAALHRMASVVIGPHGAGLANLMYCQIVEVAVVELYPPHGNFGENGDVGLGDVNPSHEKYC